MFTRRINTWKCQLLGNDGSTVEVMLRSFWDPAKVSNESVANTAAAMETVARKHKVKFAPLAATLVAE